MVRRAIKPVDGKDNTRNGGEDSQSVLGFKATRGYFVRKRKSMGVFLGRNILRGFIPVSLKQSKTNGY